MKFMVIVKATADSEAGRLPDPALFEAMGRYNEDLVNAGILLAGEGLQPSAKGLRLRFEGTARQIIPGPFEPAEDLVSGFWLWQAESVAVATDWLRRAPFGDGTVLELRPLYTLADFGDALPAAEAEREARLRAATADREPPP